MLIAKMLGTVESLKLEHLHLQVIISLICHHDNVDNRFLDRLICKAPTRSFKCALHLLLRAHDHKIHHVAEIIKLIVDAPRQTVDFFAELRIKWDVSALQSRYTSNSCGDR